MKRVLRKYNGIDRKSFPLFLKECAFRFNYGTPRQQLKTLRKWCELAIFWANLIQPLVFFIDDIQGYRDDKNHLSGSLKQIFEQMVKTELSGCLKKLPSLRAKPKGVAWQSPDLKRFRPLF